MTKAMPRMAAAASSNSFDYQYQILENVEFISSEDAKISIIVAREPRGKYSVSVLRREKKHRKELLSETGSTVFEALERLFDKSCEAVHIHASTHGYGLLGRSKHRLHRRKNSNGSGSDDSDSDFTDGSVLSSIGSLSDTTCHSENGEGKKADNDDDDMDKLSVMSDPVPTKKGRLPSSLSSSSRRSHKPSRKSRSRSRATIVSDDSDSDNAAQASRRRRRASSPPLGPMGIPPPVGLARPIGSSSSGGGGGATTMPALPSLNPWGPPPPPPSQQPPLSSSSAEAALRFPPPPMKMVGAPVGSNHLGGGVGAGPQPTPLASQPAMYPPSGSGRTGFLVEPPFNPQMQQQQQQQQQNLQDVRLRIMMPGQADVRMLERCVPTRRALTEAVLAYVRKHPASFGGPAIWGAPLRATLRRAWFGTESYDMTAYANEDLSRLFNAVGGDKDIPLLEVDVTRGPRGMPPPAVPPGMSRGMPTVVLT